jgi:hypothetical protein
LDKKISLIQGVDLSNLDSDLLTGYADLGRIQKIADKLPLSTAKPHAFWFTREKSWGINKKGQFLIKIPRGQRLPKNPVTTLFFHGHRYSVFEKPGEWLFAYNVDQFPVLHMFQLCHYFLLAYETDAKITVNDIQVCPNQELRRIMIERYGWDNFLHDTNAQIVNRETDKILYHINSELAFVKVKDTSTDRWYFLQVPPYVNTCREAVAWTFGLTEEEYFPILET